MVSKSANSLFLSAFGTSLLFAMPFRARCCCPRHDEWKHGNVKEEQLRQCSRKEASVFNLIATEDPKNKGRKRKICVSCRSRLEVEVKCQKLEVSRLTCFYCKSFVK